MTKYMEAITLLQDFSTTDLLKVTGWIKKRIEEKNDHNHILEQIGQKVTEAMERALGEPILYGSQIRRFADARLVMAVWLKQQRLSLTQIGKIVQKHHSTVCLMLQNEFLLKTDPEVAQLNERFLKELNNEDTCTQESTGS